MKILIAALILISVCCIGVLIGLHSRQPTERYLVPINADQDGWIYFEVPEDVKCVTEIKAHIEDSAFRGLKVDYMTEGG